MDDFVLEGLGSAAVGPGVRPQHRLELAPAGFEFRLTRVEGLPSKGAMRT